MQTLSLLVAYAYSLSLNSIVEAKVLGVPPNKQTLYIPDENNKWRCLNNTEIELDFSQINDGVCDCPDGSDEPGTAACGETLEHNLFYCENEGFIPRFIRGSLVGDGVCDCCDCSDEKLSGNGVVMQNTCADLAKEFDGLVERELAGYEAGKRALVDLFETFEVPYSINGSIVGPNSRGSSKVAELEEDILGLRLSKETAESMLNKTRENYLSELERDDPLLFQFERIDFEYLSKIINATYEKIETINSAYVDIVELLKELARNHSPSAGDLVVNKNMRDFNLKLQDPDTQKLAADPDLDMEQLDQINEYLHVELPKVFWTRESKFPVQYIVNKAKFVQSLIKGKTEYTEKVKSYIAYFTGLMEDIKDRYMISTQNDAVERAIMAYDEYQEKYAELLSAGKLELPKRFVTEFDNLCKVIEEEVPKLELVIRGEGENDTVGGRRRRHKSGLWGLFMDNPLFDFLLTDLESLRKQVSEYTSQIKIIDETIKEKEIELEHLKLLEESERKAAADVGLTREEWESLEQLTQLLEKIHPPKSCTSEITNGYEYHLCYNPLEKGRLIQIEDKPAGNRVVLGEFSRMYFDKSARLQAFLNHVKMDYSESDILLHLSNETSEIGQRTYFFRDLQTTDSGLVIEYTHGQRCWNGPLRSAKVFFSCSDKFTIDKVYETTRCEYAIDASGPIGCNLSFAYESH